MVKMQMTKNDFFHVFDGPRACGFDGRGQAVDLFLPDPGHTFNHSRVPI